MGGEMSSMRVRRVAWISIAFGIAWAIYFYVFHDIRLLRGSTPDDWYHVLQRLPLVLASSIRYGFILPLIASAVHGAISCRERWRSFFMEWLWLLVVYSMIAVAFEFALEYHPVAMWKSYLLFFPPFCVAGALVGRLGRTLFTKF